MCQFEIVDGVAVIPQGVKVIDCDDFYGRNELVSVVIPDSVERICEGAFNDCRNLKSVVIPRSVDAIYGGIFDGCRNLTSIVVERGNRVYDSRGNCNAVIRTKDNCLILGCSSTIIPNTVKTIGECAFECSTGLTNILIPEGVVEIGRYAFYGCTGLTSIVIPSTVEIIAEGAFEDCENLTSIVVKEGNRVYDSRENCNAIIKTETNEMIVSCASTIMPDSVKLPDVCDYDDLRDFDDFDNDFGEMPENI